MKSVRRSVSEIWQFEDWRNYDENCSKSCDFDIEENQPVSHNALPQIVPELHCSQYNNTLCFVFHQNDRSWQQRWWVVFRTEEPNRSQAHATQYPTMHCYYFASKGLVYNIQVCTLQEWQKLGKVGKCILVLWNPLAFMSADRIKSHNPLL